MIKNRALFMSAIITVFLLSLVTSCGISQEEYGRLNVELEASQEQNTKLKDEIKASQAEVTELQREIMELRGEYELVGATPAETAANIVKRYYETHTYSMYDFFVCADMSLDVWNMLKAQEIDALIQIGNVERTEEDMVESNHAWVLAETSPGNYLALETTSGQVVTEEENPLYYEGWSFDNPRQYKEFEALKQEYNVRANIVNQLIGLNQETYAEYEEEYDYGQELVEEFNRLYVGQPISEESQEFSDEIAAQAAIAAELEGRFNQLEELITDQKQELENISSQVLGLAD